MGLDSLVDSAVGAFNNAASVLGLGSNTDAFPLSLQQKVSNVIKENDKSWRKSLGYSFQVVRISPDGLIDESPSGGDDEKWREFILQINPQELQQEEIFAIEVTPTFSGVLVEHQGTTLKDINISGTTGVSPNRGAGGAFPQTGAPVFAKGRSGYKEFHDLRTYIRAYVEQKRDDKGSGQGELRLVWRNFKDHEELFVEPQRFVMKRSASKPMMYEYSIHLKAIGIATLSVKKKGPLALIDDTLEDINDLINGIAQIVQGFFGFVKLVEADILNTIIAPLNAFNKLVQNYKNGVAQVKTISALIEIAQNKINESYDGAFKASTDSQKIALQKQKDAELLAAKKEIVIQTAQATVLSAKLLKDKIKAFYNNLADNIKGQAAIIAQVSVNTATTNLAAKQADLTAIQAAAAAGDLAAIATLPSALANVASAQQTLTSAQAQLSASTKPTDYEKMKVLKTFLKGSIALDKILQNDKYFKTTSSVTPNFVNSLYDSSKSNAAFSVALKAIQDKQLEIAKAIKSNDVVAKTKADNDLKALLATVTANNGIFKKQQVAIDAKTAKPIVIDGGATIQTVAAKYLGSPDKFKDLVFYNGLVPPYIDSTPLEDNPIRKVGVARPGDKIFIPTKGAPSGQFNTVTKSSEPPIVANLSPIAKNFGVDFKLTDDMDLAVSNTGDVQLVAGVDNIAQRVVTKLLLEPGSLKRHQAIGVGLKIGEKTVKNPDLILTRIRRSLLTDNSIDQVVFADLSTESSSLFVNLVLKLKHVDQPISVPIKVA